MKNDDIRTGYLRIRYRVDVQVFILAVIIVVISCSVTFLTSYSLSYRGMISGLSERANSIHSYVDEKIEAEVFTSLNIKSDADTVVYQDAKDILERVRRAAGVRYLYTAKQEADGDFIYVVDGLDISDTDFRHIGDLIEAECIPDMQKALEGNVILPKDINHTSWGEVFIAYFPMHNGNKVVGVLGIEFDASRQYQIFRNMTLAIPVIIIFICLIAAVTAVLLFRRISNPAYKDMATTDLLTGLKNRNAFEVDLHNLELIKDRKQTAIISIDLNDLKQVNDTLGHTAGDRYIQEGSRVLVNCMPDNALPYRIGGDEFAVLLHDITLEEVDLMMQKLRGWEKKPADAMEKVSMSVGYAFFDAAIDQNLEDTLRRADSNMYTQKKEIKNTES